MSLSDGQSVLLVSDRPERSRELTARINRLLPCRPVGLHGLPGDTDPIAAIVTDVCFQDPGDIERLRRLLVRHRAPDTPFVAALRDHSRIAQVQAVALGATSIVDADASADDILIAVAHALGLSEELAASLTPEQNIEQARLMFSTIFGAAGSGKPIAAADIERGTASVVAAIAEGGIRRWLEVVWSYHDATYQHCLVVTGLAADFAAGLRFSPADQRYLSRGALLHDIGKSQIPLAILNKPGALTSDEMAIMRTHPRIGYDLLREHNDCGPEILEVVLRHHELLDGSGYPDGLRAEKIPDLVRLVTVCDIFGALIERRAYKRQMCPVQALDVLRSMEGKLEGALIRAFAPVAERSTRAD